MQNLKIGIAIGAVALVGICLMRSLFTTSAIPIDMNKYQPICVVYVITEGNMKTYHVSDAELLNDTTVRVTTTSGLTETITGDYIEIHYEDLQGGEK